LASQEAHLGAISLAERSYGISELVISHVQPDQLGLPTPCSEWDTRALLNHVFGAPFYFTSALHGEEMDIDTTPDFARRTPSDRSSWRARDCSMPGANRGLSTGLSRR
jgi:hypothetical protein